MAARTAASDMRLAAGGTLYTKCAPSGDEFILKIANAGRATQQGGMARVFAAERTAESEQLKEQDAHSPHIRRLAVRLAPNELRRHVGGRAAIRLRQV